MSSDDAFLAVERLTRWLAIAPPLSHLDAEDRRRSVERASIDAMVAGATYGEATGGLAHLNQPEDQFRAHIRSIEHDIGAQVRIVAEACRGWFEKGETPPPYYAWRVAILLRKEKANHLEREFLQAWCRHFGHFRGTRYEMIAERLEKIESSEARKRRAQK